MKPLWPLCCWHFAHGLQIGRWRWMKHLERIPACSSLSARCQSSPALRRSFLVPPSSTGVLPEFYIDSLQRCTSQGALYTYKAKCCYQNHSKACLHATLLDFLRTCFRVWEETLQSKQKRARPGLIVQALLLRALEAVD